MDKRYRVPVRSTDGSDQVFSIAAPLLAGFSLALTGVLLQLPADGSDVRWRDTSFLPLTLSTLLYLLALHYAISARNLRVSDAALSTVWSDDAKLRRARAVYDRAHSRANERAQLVLELGNVSLMTGILVVLVPSGHLSLVRCGTILLLAVTILAHVLLVTRRWIGVRWMPRPMQALLVPNFRIFEHLPDSD